MKNSKKELIIKVNRLLDIILDTMTQLSNNINDKISDIQLSSMQSNDIYSNFLSNGNMGDRMYKDDSVNAYVSIWISNLLEDFSSNPDVNKLSKKFGIIDKFGDMSWSYRFDDGVHSLKINANIYVKGSGILNLMSDNGNEYIVYLDDNMLYDIIKSLSTISSKISNVNNDTNNNLYNVSSDNYISAIDRALDSGNFDAIDDIIKKFNSKDENKEYK